MQQAKTFVFFGIAGAGKGTQIDLLEKYLTEKDGQRFVYAGTGAYFRKLMSSDSYVSTRIKGTLEAGQLMPDFFATSGIVSVLSQELTPESHLVADGYPRTIRQVEDFIEMLHFFKRDKVEVVYIEISKQESIKRNLLRGRSDDTKEGLEKRYDEYVANVLPAMEHIRKKPDFTFHVINGEQSVEAVHQEIINKLNI